jgi:hypothetical protein
MKPILFLATMAFSVLTSDAQHSILFHMNGAVDTYQIEENDSLYFNNDHTFLFFSHLGTVFEYEVASVDSINFFSQPSMDVYIEFQGSTVAIDNPLMGIGVDIEIEGAHVTITSTSDIPEINYICSGASNDGGLKIYSEEKFNLLLDDLSLTNPIGPAINIQSSKRAYINLLPGTENELTDGLLYNAAPIVNGIEEDQKAALFSEGKLKFIGSGSLTIHGQGEGRHAIRSDNELTVFEGDITVASADRDGIHADEFYMEGGQVSVTATEDGIVGDGGAVEINCGEIVIHSTSDDVTGISSQGTLTLNGGEISLLISGDRSKGLHCDTLISLNGGTIQGTASGNALLEGVGSGTEAAYCSMIKAQQDLLIDGVNIDIETTGEASRGISCDGNTTILSGVIAILSSGDGDTHTNSEGDDDAYHGACIKVDGDLFINGGEIDLSNTGDGGKGISVDGSFTYGDGVTDPQLEITTTGEPITITEGGPGGPGPGPGGNNGDYDESKAIKADGPIIINSGHMEIASADDAIKSDEQILFNNGELEVLNSIEGLEAPFITINEGLIQIASTDDGINTTQGEEVMNDDGSLMTINGGDVTVNMSGNDVDCIDSNGDIVIIGGVVNLNFPEQGPSSGLDANGSITIGPDAMVFENGDPL